MLAENAGVTPARTDAGRMLAAVVTYNPDSSLRAHLRALRSQADDVLVVDNGSANIAWINEVADDWGCLVLRNDFNEGVATALNQAAEFSINHRYRWLATFDQDSQVADGVLRGLVDVYERHASQAAVGVVCASHVDRQTRTHYHVPQHVLREEQDWRLLRVAITSGSLFPTDIFSKIGFFDQKLFIDFVDHDFCIRCRKHGLRIIESKPHVLIHSIGYSTSHRFLGRSIVCSNHSASRRYYMTRNRLEVYRRYIGFDMVWCMQGAVHLFLGNVLVLLFEAGKLAKLRAMLMGAGDFILRRFGPRREHAT
jgi:rhamnosyltransferase